MERKESKNGLELVKYGAIRLRGNFSALFMGAFAMVTPLVLVVLVPFIISMLTSLSWVMSIGIVLFAILVGPLQIGYIKYFNEVIDGKQPRISRVYSQLRFSIFTLRTMYISMLLLLMYIIGGALWIVPAGFAVSFYSMTLFFLEKYNYPRLSQAMNECAKHMVGNRLAMFSYKLIFYLVYFMLFVVAALCLALVYILAIDSILVSWIVAVCSTIIFVFLYTMVTVYFHSCNQIFFEDSLMYVERKRANKLHKEQSKVEEVKSENVEAQSIKEKENKTTTSTKKKTSKENIKKEQTKKIKKEKKTEKNS